VTSTTCDGQDTSRTTTIGEACSLDPAEAAVNAAEAPSAVTVVDATTIPAGFWPGNPPGWTGPTPTVTGFGIQSTVTLVVTSTVTITPTTIITVVVETTAVANCDSW
jgi:hypothetical protein